MKFNESISGMKKLVLTALAVWLALVLILGDRGLFTRPPGRPPLPILLGALVPVVVFILAFRFSEAFRGFVLAFDPRLGAAIQGWRFAGVGFLALYAHAVLPGSFAWPAGLGDMAIGITAPWVMLALIQRPGFAASKLFIVWNLLGMLDLIVAVGSGGLNSLLAQGTQNEITTRPMSAMPLVLIPEYFFPIFFMLHLSALFQARVLIWRDRGSEAIAGAGQQSSGLIT